MVKLTETFALSKAKARSLQKIRKLNLWACELTDVGILKKMPNLTIATLSCNHISGLADIGSCSSLEELYLRCNNISIAELAHLKNLSRLRILWLEGNPCADLPGYRHIVLHLLPHLCRLDNVAVEEQEVILAEQEPLNLDCLGSGDDITPEVQPHCDEARRLLPESVDSHGSSSSLCTPTPGISLSQTSLTASDSGTIGNHTVTDAQNRTIQEEASKQQARKEMSLERATCQSSSTTMSSMLQAVLCLLPELEPSSLVVVADAIRSRLSVL